jgi:hypothetical protein
VGHRLFARIAWQPITASAWVSHVRWCRM